MGTLSHIIDDGLSLNFDASSGYVSINLKNVLIISCFLLFRSQNNSLSRKYHYIYFSLIGQDRNQYHIYLVRQGDIGRAEAKSLYHLFLTKYDIGRGSVQ